MPFSAEILAAEASFGIDIVPTTSVLDLLDSDLKSVLLEAWQQNKGVTIAGEMLCIEKYVLHIYLGGFVAFVMGLTTAFNDIDIFVHPRYVSFCTFFHFSF